MVMPHISGHHTRGTVQSPHVTIDYDRAVAMKREQDARFYASPAGVVVLIGGALVFLFVFGVLPCLVVAAITGSTATGWVAAAVIVGVCVLIGINAWRSDDQPKQASS